MLQGGGIDVIHRREHIQDLIEKARGGDAAKTVATNLYFASEDLKAHPQYGDTWTSLYDKMATRRETLKQTRDKLGELQASLEAELEQLPDVDVDSPTASQDILPGAAR